MRISFCYMLNLDLWFLGITRIEVGARAIDLLPYFARTASASLSALPFRSISHRVFSPRMKSLLSALHKGLPMSNPTSTGSCNGPSMVCVAAQDTGITKSMLSFVPLDCALPSRIHASTQDLFGTHWIPPASLRPPHSLSASTLMILFTSRRTQRWKHCSVNFWWHAPRLTSWVW
jgi:hypothetical protein